MFRKAQVNRELDEELSGFLQMATDGKIKQGLSRKEALRQVRLERGSIEIAREDIAAAGWESFVDACWQDLRFAVRMLMKNSGFATIVILTLALGIGANTAIFNLIDAVRLRSLPVHDPQNLVSIQIKGGNHGFGVNAGDQTFLTYPLWEQIRDHQVSLSGAFAWESWDFSINQGSQEKSVIGLWVSGEMFSTLGVLPAEGRLFVAEDDRRGCGTPGVVLSYAFWQTEFGGEDAAIGKKLIIDSHPVEIIGVTSAKFTGLQIGKPFDIAVPFCSVPALNPQNADLTRRDFFWVNVMGRLKHGVSSARASAELESLSPGLIESTVPTEYSTEALLTYRNYILTAFPAGSGVSPLRESYSTSLWLLFGITGLVLLIASANIANLMLVRSSVRAREMAVRLALGASYGRLIKQMIAESLLLSGAGAILGVTLAGFFSRILVQLIRTQGDRLELDLSVDWRVLAFVSTVAILTSLVFGVAPALQALRREPVDALKSGRSETRRRQGHSFRRFLVISQIAVSLVLLVGAVLFVRSFYNLSKVDPGFRQDGVLVAFIDFDKLHLSPSRYHSTTRDLLRQIRSIPLVDSAATSTHIPFNGSWTSGVDVDGVQGASKFSWVSPGYVQTLQISLIEGRDFNDHDTSTSPRVAIVSETFVRNFLAGRSPVGKVIRTAPEPHYPATSYKIIGVVKDTKYAGLREQTSPPESYAPISQFPDVGPWAAVLIRSSAPLAAVVAAIRSTLTSVSPEIGMEFTILKKSIEDQLIRERMLALLSASFGILALLLAMIGLYGVISYIVTLRRSEIGMRMALGASRRNIVVIVVTETLLLAAAGIAIGIILALIVTRGVAALLFGIRPQDPVAMIVSAVFLVIVALAASYVPTRRATRVDPMIALRYE